MTKYPQNKKYEKEFESLGYKCDLSQWPQDQDFLNQYSRICESAKHLERVHVTGSLHCPACNSTPDDDIIEVLYYKYLELKFNHGGLTTQEKQDRVKAQLKGNSYVLSSEAIRRQWEFRSSLTGLTYIDSFGNRPVIEDGINVNGADVSNNNYDDEEDISNLEKYIEAMRECRFSDDLVSDVGLPGHLFGYRDSCKQFRVVGCLNHNGHKEGGFYNKKIEFSCNTKHCNKCFPDWNVNASVKITNRLVSGALLRNNRLLHGRTRRRIISHVMVSPPKWLHTKYADKTQRHKLREWAYSKLQEVCKDKHGSSNLDGSILFDHGYRFDRDDDNNITGADFSPHFHFAILGWVDISQTNKMYNNTTSPGGPGWVVKYISNRKGKDKIYGLIRYLLSHSSVFLDDVTGDHGGDPTVSYVRDGMVSLFGANDKVDKNRAVNSTRSGSSEHSYRFYGSLSYNKLNVAVESQYRKDIAILELTSRYHNSDHVNAVVSSINDDDIRDSTYGLVGGPEHDKKLTAASVDNILYKSYMKRDYPAIPKSTFLEPCPKFDPKNPSASDDVLNEVTDGLRAIEDTQQEENTKYIQVKYDRYGSRGKRVEIRKNRHVWYEVNGKVRSKENRGVEIDKQPVRWPLLDDVSGRPKLLRSGFMQYCKLWPKKRFMLPIPLVNSRYLVLILDTSKDRLCPECQHKMKTICWDGKDPPPVAWLQSLELDVTVKVDYNPQICYYRDVISTLIGYPYLKAGDTEFSYDSGIYSMPEKIPSSITLQGRIRRNISYQSAKYALKVNGAEHITKDMVLDFMRYNHSDMGKEISLFNANG